MSFFLERYKKFGHEIDPNKIKLKQSIRVNTLKISEKELIKRLKQRAKQKHAKLKIKKIPFLNHGYWIDSELPIGATQEYLQGYYYIQEAASQIPVQVLNPKPNELVLDMCAAPGSKTTQIAQYMKNEGVIVAVDKDISRLRSLQNNIERLGVKNTIIFQKDARFVDDFKLKFDKILLDAPCSGNFCTEKTPDEWFRKRNLDDIRQLSKYQKNLLKTALKCLKPNGTLVYSTCSLEPEENEEVIEYALDNFKIKLENIDLKITIGEAGLTKRTRVCKRFWPEKDKVQGFFVGKIKLK